jgi:alpha-D-ribose 1-methylphosphonate 5-triphosphate synthase subunit PhnH
MTDAVPAPGLSDPVHDAQQAFRIALEAWSRPGRIQSLGTPIEGLDIAPAQAWLLLALTDEETPVWWQQPSPARERWLRFHTGARTVREPRQASFAVVQHAAEMPELARFPAGSAAAPERSCTVLVEVPSLRSGPAMDARGPGIPQRVRLEVAGLPEGFWAEWQANHAAFPQGVDLFLSCGAEVLGLPRTTRIGRLQEV